MSTLDKDLNATIAAAVQAKVEAAIASAMASDDLMQSYIVAALTQPIEDRYSSKKRTFLSDAIQKAVQEVAQNAVVKQLETDRPLIEAEIAKILRNGSKHVAAQILSAALGGEEDKRAYWSVSVHFDNKEN